MSNQGLKSILRSPATWLATLAAFQPKNTEALNALPVSQEGIRHEIRDDFAVSREVSADTYTGVVDSLSATPQKRFDDVFGALTNLNTKTPDQFLELCAVIKEGKAHGLDVSAAMLKLSELANSSRSNSDISEIWNDFEQMSKTGKPNQPVKASRQAMAEARKALVSLSSKPGVGRDSIEALHQRLAERYGVEEASAALVTVFPKLSRKARGEFDRNALLRLAQYSSDFYGRFERLQMIFEALRPGAVLFDSNQNGQIDPHDRLFSTSSSKFERLGDELADEVNVRNAVINAAHELNARKPGFAGNLFNQTFPEEFFDRVADNGVFESKPDISESLALLSVFSQPSSSKFDCAAGSKTVVQYRAALAVLGPDDFDRVFDGLVMGSHMTSRAHHLEFRPTGGTTADEVAPDTFLAELKPGDVVYFGQQHVTEAARNAGWSGEWATYLGNRQFYGHPVGIKSYEGMRSYGDLRHKKWTLLPSIRDYDDGGWSRNHLQYQKTQKQRVQSMKSGLDEIIRSNVLVGAYATRSMMELAIELDDLELVSQLQTLFLRSLGSAAEGVRLGKLTSKEASHQMGVSSEVMHAWLHEGLPQKSEVTIASIELWSGKK